MTDKSGRYPPAPNTIATTEPLRVMRTRSGESRNDELHLHPQGWSQRVDFKPLLNRKAAARHAQFGGPRRTEPTSRGGHLHWLDATILHVRTLDETRRHEGGPAPCALGALEHQA